MDAATLPDLDQLDSKALKSLILAMHNQVFSQREQLASRDVEIEHLELLIAKLRYCASQRRLQRSMIGPLIWPKRILFGGRTLRIRRKLKL